MDSGGINYHICNCIQSADRFYSNEIERIGNHGESIKNIDSEWIQVAIIAIFTLV